MNNMMNTIDTAFCYMGKLLREEILSSRHKKNIFFPISLMLCLCEMLDAH